MPNVFANPMPQLKIKATLRAFFDREAVMRAISESEGKALGKAGMIVRQEARKLIKPAKRATKKTIDQLSPEVRKRYHVAVAMAKKQGKPKPKLPRLSYSAAPGEPPVSQTGLLRDHVYYSFDQGTRSVVIGPARLNSKTANLRSLEEGGPTVNQFGKTVTLKPHPFMRPALSNRQAAVNNCFRNAL